MGYRLRIGRSVDRIPVRSKIFDIRPHRDCGPPRLLYNWYCVSFLEIKQPERGVNHSPPSGAEDKERVELCLYSRFVPPWTLVA